MNWWMRRMETLQWWLRNLTVGTGLGRFLAPQSREDLIALMTPGVTTLNLGDQIIEEAVMQELADLFPERFIVTFSSHAGFRRKSLALYNSCALRFWGGANMIDRKLEWAFNCSPDIPVYEAWCYRRNLLLGSGMGNHRWNRPGFNVAAKLFYRTLLSREGLHSVRDEVTRGELAAIGITNVICTGCPTTWRLTPEHCAKIPVRRAENVVFTLTDYCPDPEADRRLIALLRDHYRHLFFFPQGAEDLAYFRRLEPDTERMTLLPPDLAHFHEVLIPGEVDYIGTRLHGGMRAMQRRCRALILSIDNRASDMARTLNFPMAARLDEEAVRAWITAPRPCTMRIDQQAIETWKNQFRQPAPGAPVPFSADVVRGGAR